MEIQNGPVKCVNNHFFNASVHSVCPICGSPAVGGYAPADQPVANMAPSGGMGSFIPTEAPQAAAAPANSWAAPGGGVNAFSSPTVIGGDISAGVEVDPVVGWLVCVEGPLRGAAWNLHAGYNYIGRETGDIHVPGDSQISRERHATVAYYDKNRTYYVGPAEGRNIIELNGEPVFAATQLSSRDVIKIGATKLMFVPLCGEDFTWESEKSDD